MRNPIGKGQPRLADYPRNWLADALERASDVAEGVMDALYAASRRVRPPMRTTAYWIPPSATPRRDAIERELTLLVDPGPSLRTMIDETLAR